MTPQHNQVRRNEHLEIAERRADGEYQARLDAARSIYGSICQECGSDDGTRAWAWFNVETAERNPGKYGRPAFLLRYKDHTHALYTPCDGCNPRGVIQPGYSRIEYDEVLTWVAAQKEANPEEVAMKMRFEGLI
jgi:hypothetical protein